MCSLVPRPHPQPGETKQVTGNNPQYPGILRVVVYMILKLVCCTCIMQLLCACGKDEEVYEDVLDFTKRTLQKQYKGKQSTLETELASPSAPSHIVQTTVRDLAEKELTLCWNVYLGPHAAKWGIEKA